MEFPLSDKFEDVLRLVCTHYKVQITVVYTDTVLQEIFIGANFVYQTKKPLE